MAHLSWSGPNAAEMQRLDQVFQSIEGITSCSNQALGALVAINERLFGPQPQGANAETQTFPNNAGSIDFIFYQLKQLERSIDAISSEITRLQQL